MISPMVHYRTVRAPEAAIPVPHHHAQLVYGQPPVAMRPVPVQVRSPTPFWQVRADPRLGTPAVVHREVTHFPSTPAVGHREVTQLPCTPSVGHREVRVGIPRSPAVVHREVRAEVPATPNTMTREVRTFKEMTTPSIMHREVRIVTPAVQHRPVRTMVTPVTTPQPVYREVRRPSAPHVVTSPLVQHRVVRPSGYPAAQLSSSYPSYTPNVAGGPTQPVPHAAPAPQRTPMVAAQAPSASGPVVWLQNSRPANTYAAEGQAFAESRIRSAADFLPHTPPNALLDWLKYLVSGQMEPGEPTPDGGKYWDKRRVQTSLRRLLESLQEWAETRRLPDKDGSFDDMTLAREVLQGILQALPGRRRTTVENMKMTEQDFINGVQMLGVWPPELTPNDRKEVFAALLVPSQRIVRLLKEGQMSLPRALNCQSLADGLASVPYVLPDFPVPLHLLKAILLKPAEIAKDIAARFCSDGGVDAIKDFYISGLISLEEVQISLPYLLQIRKLEEAVELILRSSRFFTPHEWQKYVYSIRGEDSQEQARVEDFEVHNTPSAPARCESPKAIQRIPEDERADDCAATLRHFLEDPGKRTVVNWNTAKAKRRSHQADEGAGVQLCGDRPTFLAGQAPEPGDEGIRLISLDWHNECLGPLLAGAFVRCCQIHQAKSSGDREKA